MHTKFHPLPFQMSRGGVCVRPIAAMYMRAFSCYKIGTPILSIPCIAGVRWIFGTLLRRPLVLVVGNGLLLAFPPKV